MENLPEKTNKENSPNEILQKEVVEIDFAHIEYLHANTEFLYEQLLLSRKAKKIWKDHVFSKIIAFGLIAILTAITTWITSIVTNKKFLEVLNDFFTSNFRLWHYLLFSIIIGLIYFAIKKTSDKIVIRKPNKNRKIGEYRFQELFLILSTKMIDIPEKISMENSKVDLLKLFFFYNRFLNIGVNSKFPRGNHGIFLMYIIGPELISYGLCETEKRENETEMTIKISNFGRNFWAQCEKWRVFKKLDSEMNEMKI